MLKNDLIINKNNNFPLDRYEIINKYKGNCVNFIMGVCDGNCNLFHSVPLRKNYVEVLEKTVLNKKIGKDSKQIKEEFKGFCSEFIVSNCTNTNCKFYHSEKLRTEFDKNKNPCYCSYYLKYGNCRIDWCKYIHDNTAYENYNTNLLNAKKDLENFKKKNIEPSYCVFWENNCCSDTKCKFVHPPKYTCEKKYITALKLEKPAGPQQIYYNEDSFVGLNLNPNYVLCKKFNCDCSKHNMLEQLQTNVGVVFDNYIKTKKIPLIELTMKLNKIYFDNFLLIQSQLIKENIISQIELPNNNLSLESLEKLFNIIENNQIYEKNLTQTEYSLLYEIFRRSKSCPKYKYFSDGIIYDASNKPNYCYYGRNCIKGNHGFNGICGDDLYHNSCKCKDNTLEIKKLEEEIEQINSIIVDDEYVVVNNHDIKKNKIKDIRKKIDQLQANKLLHLNRDGITTDTISVKNISKNFLVNTIFNSYLTKMLQIKSSHDYNNYINNEKDKPECYSVYLNTKTNFAIDHKWSIELWEKYVNYTVIEKNTSINICQYFTFNSFQNLLKTIIPLYENPLNKEKNWTTFLLNYNNKLHKWKECFDNTNYVCVDYNQNNQKIYKDQYAFLLDINILDDERVTGKLEDKHKTIINENQNILKLFLENHENNKLVDWLESNYDEEANNFNKINQNINSLTDNSTNNEINIDDFDDDDSIFDDIDSMFEEEIKNEEKEENNNKCYDLDYETINLINNQKYFLSYDASNQQMLLGPLTNNEYLILRKKAKGISIFKKTVNNIQVGCIVIKSKLSLNLINIICNALNIKYSKIKNTSNNNFLINIKYYDEDILF